MTGTSLDGLEKEHGPLPKTRAVRTGSGGKHYYFKYPDFLISNSVSGLGPGLDIRGDGGYVIAEGARHRSGRLYELEKNLEPAVPPPWLLAKLSEARSTGQGGKSGRTILPQGGIKKGRRNDLLFRLACAFRAKGASSEAP